MARNSVLAIIITMFLAIASPVTGDRTPQGADLPYSAQKAGGATETPGRAHGSENLSDIRVVNPHDVVPLAQVSAREARPHRRWADSSSRGLEDANLEMATTSARVFMRDIPPDSGSPAERGELAEASPTTTRIVTTTNDNNALGTLRRCLNDAQPGDLITFSPSVFPPASPATILVSSALPAITDDNLTIDASNAGVIIDGSNLASGNGLYISSADNVSIRGLQIVHFPGHGIVVDGGATGVTIGGDRSVGSGPIGQGNRISGITSSGTAGVLLWGTGTTGNTVKGNFIGTDISGQAADYNNIGVAVASGASGNIIGGTTASANNVLSGNYWAGATFQDAGTSNNLLIGNMIGTNADGMAALGNTLWGVIVHLQASNNTIGGSSAAERNVISGNGESGVIINHTGTTGNSVVGNYIGTDRSGISAVGNFFQGVVITSGASNNVIGGEAPDTGNLISGNYAEGIQIAEPGSSGNRVLGNLIGTDVTGALALPNGCGIMIGFGASSNVVGGEITSARNIISGNSDEGVLLQNDNTTGNQVQGNFIGIDVLGTQALGNREGVVVTTGAANNTIGGATNGARNVISGNRQSGVDVQQPETTGNQVIGNFIGTNADGTGDLGNGTYGVIVCFSAHGNFIGGTSQGAGNVISGNDGAGLVLYHQLTVDNQVSGNLIGTDLTGAIPVPNIQDGVIIGGGCSNNVLGGSSTGARNIISGNTRFGVILQNTDTALNRIEGNYIGTATNGLQAVPNGSHGIVIADGPRDNTIGGETLGTGNLVSGNSGSGIQLMDVTTSSNQVLGNYIGTDRTGQAPLPNDDGVVLILGTNNNAVGGQTSGARNVISGNNGRGVWISDSGTTGNAITGNYIGVNLDGTEALSNTKGVVLDNGANGNTIGSGNVIAFNEEAGVLLLDSTTRKNFVTGNSVHNNGELGIDLGDDGVTPNDAGDSDTGPNDLQNFPVLTGAFATTTGTLIEGTVSSTASKTFTVEFFTSPSCDSSGYGEGASFLGSRTVTTDALGWASFSESFSVSFAVGTLATATVTDANGNTSEFSACMQLLACTAPDTVSLTPSIVAGNVRLDWPQVPRALRYQVYRSLNQPYFTPGTIYATVLFPSWTDTQKPGGPGDPNENRFYRVRAVNGCGDGAVSTPVGEFDFTLVP